MSKRKQWANRIVGSGVMRAGDLLANPKNWRVHPRAQQDALAGALDEVGWVQTVLINKRTSEEWGEDQFVETMVDGHLRASLALRQGEDTPVPFDYVDLTPQEEALVMATLDPIGALAVADKEQLDALLHEVQAGDAALQELLSELAEKNGLYFTPEDYHDLDEQLEELDGLEEVDIKISIPSKYRAQVEDWLANGEAKTAPGFGKGVMKRCGLL